MKITRQLLRENARFSLQSKMFVTPERTTRLSPYVIQSDGYLGCELTGLLSLSVVESYSLNPLAYRGLVIILDHVQGVILL